MDFTPRHALPYLLPNQAQKHVTFNDALSRLDSVVQMRVLSTDMPVQPEDPVDGDAYILPAGASGADWTSGSAGQLACVHDGGWVFLTPQDGWRAVDVERGGMLVFLAGNWHEVFRFDQATGFVVLGEGEAQAPLTVDTGRFGLVAGQAGIVVQGETGSERAEFRSVGPGPNAAFQGYGARGSLDLPEATQNGDRLFAILGSGHDGAGFVIPLPAQIDMVADGDWSPTSHGTDILIRTTPEGATASARAERVRFKSNGKVGIGTSEPSCRLHVEGAVRCGSFSAASLPSASDYGAGAMIHVPDASGGAIMAFSDGTDWRRTTDRSVVS